MLRRSLRWHYSVLFVVAMAAGISPLAAAPPWASLVPFKKVEADARKEYKVTNQSTYTIPPDMNASTLPAIIWRPSSCST